METQNQSHIKDMATGLAWVIMPIMMVIIDLRLCEEISFPPHISIFAMAGLSAIAFIIREALKNLKS